MSENVELKFDMKLTPGNAVGDFKLTEENYEQLKALQSSSQWKLYSKILSVISSGFSQSILPLEEPMKIMKTLGTIAGLNLANAQLGVLVADYQSRIARRVTAETKKQSGPARKSGEEKRE